MIRFIRRAAPPRLAATLCLFCAALPARAEERDYCPSRPGLGTTPCTISPGRVSVETAIADWTLEEDPDQRTDTVLIGDTLARIGLTDAIEAQIGWTPFGHVRTRDKAAGTIGRADRVGDVVLGAKANLRQPDGKGLSFAVQPFVTLPVGRPPVGAGEWGAGIVAPLTFDLNDTLNLQFTTEADAAVDEDGDGRHLAYSGVLGLSAKLTAKLGATIELQALRDDDPARATTQAFASLSLGWMPTGDLQLDTGAVAGLDHDSADVELYVGVSRRF